MIQFRPRGSLGSPKGDLDIPIESMTFSRFAEFAFRNGIGQSIFDDMLIRMAQVDIRDWRSAHPEELAALQETFDFVHRTKTNFGITTAPAIQFRVQRERYSGSNEVPFGTGSASHRALKMNDSLLALAVSSDTDPEAINARGTVVHELIHALGNVRISFKKLEGRPPHAIITTTGLVLFQNGHPRFTGLEEYIASRVQSLYYARHGYSEYEVTSSVNISDNELTGAIADAVIPLLRASPVIDQDLPSGAYTIPSLDHEIRKNAYYGIVRRAFYEIAQRMFPDQARLEAINSFDRLALRAQSLGDYRNLLKPMVKALGAKAVRALGLINVKTNDWDPYLLIAAFGASMKFDGEIYAHHIERIERGAILHADKVAKRRPLFE